MMRSFCCCCWNFLSIRNKQLAFFNSILHNHHHHYQQLIITSSSCCRHSFIVIVSIVIFFPEKRNIENQPTCANQIKYSSNDSRPTLIANHYRSDIPVEYQQNECKKKLIELFFSTQATAINSCKIERSFFSPSFTPMPNTMRTIAYYLYFICFSFSFIILQKKNDRMKKILMRQRIDVDK